MSIQTNRFECILALAERVKQINGAAPVAVKEKKGNKKGNKSTMIALGELDQGKINVAKTMEQAVSRRQLYSSYSVHPSFKRGTKDEEARQVEISELFNELMSTGDAEEANEGSPATSSSFLQVDDETIEKHVSKSSQPKKAGPGRRGRTAGSKKNPAYAEQKQERITLYEDVEAED